MSNDPVVAVQNWGKQTIIFALGLRSDPRWRALTEMEQAKLVHSEYGPMCERLWNEARDECRENLNTVPRIFSKKILRWVQDNVPLV